MPVIDAHQHYWRTAAQAQPWRTHAHAGLERDFLPADLAPLLEAQGIDATVLVQSVDGPDENDRLAGWASDPTVAGVVGWLPVADPAAARAELERTTLPKHVGVRCLIADDPLDWLAEPAVVELLRELAARRLAWDVVPITAAQTRNLVRAAQSLPELHIVVDHLGRPPVETGGWEPWATHMAALAACPNVAVKVSVGLDVLSAWERWDPAALRPYVDLLADGFGPERLMIASNWPVVTMRADHATAWRDVAAQLLDRFPDQAARAQVLGATAAAVYHLDLPDSTEGENR